jgi:plasmid stabilization system protein ParE
LPPFTIPPNRGSGAISADAYFAGLERTFGLLADFPGIGQSADNLVAGYRRFRFQAHFIFYSEDADGIVFAPCRMRRRIFGRNFSTRAGGAKGA